MKKGAWLAALLPLLCKAAAEGYDYYYEEGDGKILGVSGMGLMIGVKPERPAPEVIAGCRERGVLCLSAKDKVRLLPALNIPDDLLAKAVGILCEVCAGKA